MTTLKDHLHLRSKAAQKRERKQLGFLRQPRVRWLSPPLLLKAGIDVAVSSTFGRFADKRELETAEQGDFFDYRSPESELWRGEELWIDYLSDTGDGWEATQTMAWLLAQEELDTDEASLPRGDLLLLGGDQVYPAPGDDGVAYEDRFLGPFSASSAGGGLRDLFALPGNHDWYDGLVSFLRIFCRPDSIEAKRIGDWRTRQKRSYWALGLPHDWWIWAIDIQLDTFIDNEQLAYFERAAAQLGEDQRVILLTAKPSWLKAETGQFGPASWRNLAYFERKMIRERGAELAFTLTGDLHHYSRYEPTGGGGPARITSGGGGAYLSATHSLPDPIYLTPAQGEGSEENQRSEIYPDAPTSRRLSWGAFLIPWHNPGFAALLGFVYAIGGAAALGGGANLVVPGLLVAVLYAYADFERRLAKLAAGASHALVHLGVAAAIAYAIDPESLGGWLALVGAELVAGSLLGSTLFAAYLLLVHLTRGHRAPQHTNEVFAGQGIRDYKNFLRIHLDRDGRLTLYALGVDRICREWDYRGADAQPRFAPRGERPAVKVVDEVVRPPAGNA